MIGNKRNGRLSGRTRLALTGTAMAGALAASVLVVAPAHAGDYGVNCRSFSGGEVCVAFTDIDTAHGWIRQSGYDGVRVKLTIQRTDGGGYATTSIDADGSSANTWSLHQASSACAKGYVFDSGRPAYEWWVSKGQVCISR